MIWLIGCKGMLGSELAAQLTEKKMNWVGTGEEVDITVPDKLEKFIQSTETETFRQSGPRLSPNERRVRWIINCSAYTAVDKAEDEPDRARAVNTDGVLNIARAARNHGARLIHISTDYVFDGRSGTPYREDDRKNPSGVYGRTKSDGEDAVMSAMTQYYILRTAWLYGFDGRNFVYTMVRLLNEKDEIRVVSDQFGTPTLTCDLAAAILKLIEKSDGATELIGKNSSPSYGIYNFTDAGETSWFDFANRINEIGKKCGRVTHDCRISACTTQEYVTKAVRPAYSVLDKSKITEALRIKIPAWQHSLEQFMKSPRFSVK